MRKLIAITGGSKGIGRAIAERFARAGFDVATCSRDKAELSKMQDEFKTVAPDARLHFIQADVSKKESVNDFTKFVLDLKQPVEVLVNNAGYFVPGEITSEPDGTLESMMSANLFSAYHTTRGLASAMKKNKRGHIFNMCSIASIKAYANGGSYAISKFALLGFSKCLREELKPFRIRVTAVMPGATRTRSWEGVDLPEERFMKVEDVAESVFSIYSLSERSVVEEILIRPMDGDI